MEHPSPIADRVVKGLPELLGNVQNPAFSMMSGMIQSMATQHLNKLPEDKLAEVIANCIKEMQYWLYGEYPIEGVHIPLIEVTKSANQTASLPATIESEDEYQPLHEDVKKSIIAGEGEYLYSNENGSSKESL